MTSTRKSVVKLRQPRGTLNPGGFDSAPAELVSIGGITFFAAHNGANGIELWKSDGTVAGTTMLELAAGGSSTQPTEITVAGNRVFFLGWTPGFGRELCVSRIDAVKVRAASGRSVAA